MLQQTGEAHKKLRRLIAEPLSVDGLKKYFQFINSLAIETLDQWSGRKILVLEETSTVESYDHFFVEFGLKEAFLNLSDYSFLQFTLKVIGNMIMSLEPTGEEQEKFRTNFKIISGSFASLPFKVPGTAFYRGIQVTNCPYSMQNMMNGQLKRDDYL